MRNEPQHPKIVGFRSSPQPTGNPKIIFLKPIIIVDTMLNVKNLFHGKFLIHYLKNYIILIQFWFSLARKLRMRQNSFFQPFCGVFQAKNR